eukprot:366115-Chlamydomonas_euryale.AAC.11
MDVRIRADANWTYPKRTFVPLNIDTALRASMDVSNSTLPQPFDRPVSFSFMIPEYDTAAQRIENMFAPAAHPSMSTLLHATRCRGDAVVGMGQACAGSPYVSYSMQNARRRPWGSRLQHSACGFPCTCKV